MTREQETAFHIEERKHEVSRLQRIIRDSRATCEDIRIAQDQLQHYQVSTASAAEDEGLARNRMRLFRWPVSSDNAPPVSTPEPPTWYLMLARISALLVNQAARGKHRE
jgi:hypothetical protein